MMKKENIIYKNSNQHRFFFAWNICIIIPIYLQLEWNNNVFGKLKHSNESEKIVK
jgi:hypothetical protein